MKSQVSPSLVPQSLRIKLKLLTPKYKYIDLIHLNKLFRLCMNELNDC